MVEHIVDYTTLFVVQMVERPQWPRIMYALLVLERKLAALCLTFPGAQAARICKCASRNRRISVKLQLPNLFRILSTGQCGVSLSLSGDELTEPMPTTWHLETNPPEIRAINDNIKEK